MLAFIKEVQFGLCILIRLVLQWQEGVGGIRAEGCCAHKGEARSLRLIRWFLSPPHHLAGVSTVLPHLIQSGQLPWTTHRPNDTDPMTQRSHFNYRGKWKVPHWQRKKYSQGEKNGSKWSSFLGWECSDLHDSPISFSLGTMRKWGSLFQWGHRSVTGSVLEPHSFGLTSKVGCSPWWEGTPHPLTWACIINIRATFF